MRTIFVATMLLALGLAALATPSTLIWIPSTDIQPKGVWHLGEDAYIYTVGAAKGSATDLGLTYGVTDRIEVGVDVFSGLDNPAQVNAKVLVTPAKFAVPIAVGLYNYSTTSAVNQSVLYAVGSYTLPAKSSGVRATFGGYTGRSAALGGTEKSGVLLGLDKTMGKWWYGADYQSGKNYLGAANVGVGYNFADNVGVILGYDFYNDPTLVGANGSVTAQVDINF